MSGAAYAPGAVSGKPHVFVRPLWTCLACGLDWPCEPARLALLEEYRADRTALGVFMTGLLYDCAWDLRDTPSADHDALSKRFVLWALLPIPTV